MARGNDQPELTAGPVKVDVLGTAAAVVDMAGAAADDGATLGWSRRDHEEKYDPSVMLDV